MEVNEIQCKYPRISNDNGRLDSAKIGHNQKMDPDEEEERNKKRSNANGGVRGDGVDLGDGVGRLDSWPPSRIVRVSQASGGKDRHSKVLTSKGLRDRRVRLSVNTAIQFYDLQDRLGYDQPSKTVEWLLRTAAASIAELPPMNNPFPDTPKQLSDDKRSSTDGSDQLGFDSTEVDLDGILLDEPYCTIHFDRYTCPDYSSAGISPLWDCMKCLKASSPTKDKLLPGACLISNNTVKDACHGEEKELYPRGCPSRFGWLALIGLALCILFFSSGIGTVPWIVNSEIYPLRFRGICGGIAATANWISSLIVAQSFLSLTEAIGTSWTVLLFGVISMVALFCFLVCVPETKGLHIEEVREMLENGDESFTVEILGEKI